MKLIISSCPKDEAERIAARLLEEKMVACINILPKAISKYWWKGKLESDSESILFMKTTDEVAPRVIKRVKEIHSYEVPEIICIAIEAGNEDYIQWVKEVVGSEDRERR